MVCFPPFIFFEYFFLFVHVLLVLKADKYSLRRSEVLSDSKNINITYETYYYAFYRYRPL